MHRHHGGLADAEHEKRIEQRQDTRAQPSACHDPAGGEICGASGDERPDDRGQQQAHRGRHQEHEIDPALVAGLVVALVRDQRIGRNSQDLVEQEQREEVARERDPHGRRDGDGKADVERRLPWLVVPAHIADGIDRIDDPQRRGDAGEQHPQRLDRERNLDTAEDLAPTHGGAFAGQHHGQQVDDDHPEERGRGGKRHRLAQIAVKAGDGDAKRAERWDGHGKLDQKRPAHCPPHPARSSRAASPATPAERSVQMPK